ncbi:MAG: PKD domain-containing protein, partial [Thermoplasmata archaeon]|nr:PKD domain-containing protein [Thermoplasmata archaeon]
FPDGEGYYEFYSIANDTAGNTETKTTADEIAGYDATHPSSSINPMAYWYTSLPVITTASASDALAGVKQVTLYYRYSTDNATWGSWTAFATDTSSPWQWNFNAPYGDGYYEFYCIAEDDAGNTETKTTADEYIAIDTTPPSTTLSASPSYGNYVTSSSVISLSASDNVADVKTTYYRIWNGSWHPAPGTGMGIGNNFFIYSGAFSLKKEGKNYIEFYSEDNAGNVESINNETLIVDNAPPSITLINANPSSQVVGGYVNISCCVVDSDVGVDDVYLEVYYPDGSFANFTMIYSPCTTYYRNEIYNIVGTYDFTIYAKDLLGNAIKSSVYHFTITTGNNPPATPSKPSGPSSGYACVTYTYTTSTTDPEGDNIYYLFDWGDGTTSGWIGPFASGAIATASHKWNSPGTYYIRAKAKDDKGAESGWSSYLVVTIGPVNNPPVTTASLSPSSPNGENGWYISSVNVSLYATDPDGDAILYTKYRIDGGSWITYTGTFTISSDGEHLVEFYSEDDRGAVEDIKNITVKIDKTEPSVYIQRPVQGYLYLFNREIWPLASGNTIVIGWIAVRAVAYDSHSGIDNVSFYVDGIQQSIDKMEPYEWLWRGDIGWKYLQVVAYNKAGLKQESDTIFLYIFSL